MPLAVFYVSIHGTRALPSALYLLRRLDEEYSRKACVSVGLLASWACWHMDLFDYILLPDYPVARCPKDDRLGVECARDAATETLNATAWFVDSCRLPAEKLVPVLQGWDPESYAASYEGVSEVLGAAPRYVAPGRRNSSFTRRGSPPGGCAPRSSPCCSAAFSSPSLRRSLGASGLRLRGLRGCLASRVAL